jgi:hypothetical protein
MSVPAAVTATTNGKAVAYDRVGRWPAANNPTASGATLRPIHDARRATREGVRSRNRRRARRAAAATMV